MVRKEFFPTRNMILIQKDGKKTKTKSLQKSKYFSARLPTTQNTLL